MSTYINNSSKATASGGVGFFGLFFLGLIVYGIASLIEKLKPVHDRREYRKKWKEYYNNLDQDAF